MSKVFGCAASLAILSACLNGAQAQTSAPVETTGSEEEQTRIFLRADRLIDDSAKRQIIAEGDVEARYEDRVLRADRVIYDLANESVRAQGNVQIIDADGTVRYADEIQVDEDLEDGYALNFSTRMGGDAVAMASAAVRKDGTVNALEQMVYTACPICEEGDSKPTWALRARKAVQDQDDQMISYQDAILEIKGVPVFYVPYFAHPDPSSGRRSGLMIPDAGVSSKLGVYYQQPYYLALSPSQELTISPMISENVAPLLELDYGKRFYSGFINATGSITEERLFDSDGQKIGDKSWRSSLSAVGKFEINDTWNWGFGIERQSDDLFDRRYDVDTQQSTDGLFDSQSRELMTQLYAVGQTENFYAEGGILSFQGLLASDDPGTSPLVAPMIYADKHFDLGKFGDFAISGSTAVIERDEDVSSARGTIDANWRARQVLGPGLVLEPFAEARGDVYDIKDPTGFYEDQTTTRGLGLAGAQLSWPLVGGAKGVQFIVEPTIMAAVGTKDANDLGIPNEDALSFEAAETTLFLPNGAANYDLWEGGTRMSAGFSASASWGDSSSITGIFGRRWREEADDAFAVSSNLDGTESDYVTAMGLRFGKELSLQTSMRLDKDDFALRRIDTRAQINFSRLKTTAQYYKLDGKLRTSGEDDEGVILSGSLRVTKNWSGVFGISRNIADERNLRQTLGIAFEDDCSYFQIAYERSDAVDRELGPSEAIRFRFALKTLGTVGDQNFD